jgi:hypothetical protein
VKLVETVPSKQEEALAQELLPKYHSDEWTYKR